MACMEHVCNACGCQWFNNISRGACPDCESLAVSHYFDESLGEEDPEKHDTNEDEDDDEDGEEEDEDQHDDDDGDGYEDDDNDWYDEDDDEDEEWEEEDCDTSRWRYY